MISFNLKSGVRHAYPTSLFDEIIYLQEGEIHFYSRLSVVKILGRNLWPLYQHMIQRRVKEIREYSDEKVADGDLAIESIVIHSDYEGNQLL